MDSPNELSHIQLSTVLGIFITSCLIGFAVNDHSSDSLEGYAVSATESQWRIASTALFTPLLFEFLLDELAWVIVPTLHLRAKEDPIGHWFIITSLIPSTYYFTWILQGKISLLGRLILLSIGHVVTLLGIFRKLTTFGSDLLEYFKPLLVLSLFIASELFIFTGIQFPLRTVNQYLILIGVMMKFAMLPLLMYSAKIRAIVFELFAHPASMVFMNHRYIVTTLLVAMGTLLVWDLVTALLLISCPFQLEQFMGHRMLGQIVCVVIASVFTGRITRRSLAAAEEHHTMEVKSAILPLSTRLFSPHILPLSSSAKCPTRRRLYAIFHMKYVLHCPRPVYAWIALQIC